MTLKAERHWIWNVGIVGLLAALYAGMFVILYPHIGFAGAPFAAATVMTTGWLFGACAGFVASLLIAFENLLLLHVTGGSMTFSTIRHGLLAGMITLIVLGIAAGRMSDLDRKVKDYAHQLQFQAFHDPLTGLPNRALFSDRLEHATARAARGTASIAVLFIDLDGFKRINDHHGHAIGDRLLQAISDRVRTSLRLGDTLARLGGDEFVVLLEDIEELSAAQHTAERLIGIIERPIFIDGSDYSVSASIGVAFCPAGESRSEDLLREADRAMYHAKTTGKSRYEIFESAIA